MPERTLAQAVAALARIVAPLPDAALDRPWGWRSYDEEGVRFALLLTYHELREHAALTAAERAAGGAPTVAQRLLARHQTAYRDLCGLLAGVPDAELDSEPAPGEWPLRTVVGHTLAVERAFLVQIAYAVERRRAGETTPKRAPESFAAAYPEIDDSGGLGAILDRYAALHERALRELTGLGDDELDTPSRWWEDEPMTVRFRLGRFDAHLRQHTVQAEKTLVGIGHPPGEAERLVRLIYNALGDVEGAALGGAPPPRAAERERALADASAARGDEIAAAAGVKD